MRFRQSKEKLHTNKKLSHCNQTRKTKKTKLKKKTKNLKEKRNDGKMTSKIKWDGS
jgi:hypothetical protein